jgi:hypothetical protein
MRRTHALDPLLGIDARIVTYYFRKSFTLSDPTAIAGLNLELLRNDGAIVYLNGQEILRDNMPTGAVDFQTLASSSVPSAGETTYFAFKLPATGLVAGTNVLAIEVQQSTPGSSDLGPEAGLAALKEVAVDSSGNGWTGDRLNSTSADWVAGYLGGAMNFGGKNNNYIRLDAHVAGFQSMAIGSLTAWFQTNSGSDRTILSASDGDDNERRMRLLVSSGTLQYEVSGDTGTSAASLKSRIPINDNQWHHAAVTVDAANMTRLFVDGAEMEAGVVPFSAASSK